MKVVLHTEFSHPALKSSWDELLPKSPTRSVFQTYDWHKAWWESYRGGAELKLLLFYQNDRLIGLAPLVLRQTRLNGVSERILTLLGTDNAASDYADLIVSGESSAVVDSLASWLKEDRSWSVCDFVNIPTQSPNLELLGQAVKQLGLRQQSYTLYDAPAIAFVGDDQNRELLNKKSFKRHINYFRKNGTLEFNRLDNSAKSEQLLDLFFEQHIRRWQDTATPSLFLNNQHKDFYRRILPMAWTHFSGLIFNGQTIAFHFGFEHNSSLLWYKPSFDISLSKHSPGEVLLHSLLEYSIKAGLSEFDFSVGSEPYKYRFANTIRTCSRLLVFRGTLAYLLQLSRRKISLLKQFKLIHQRSQKLY